MVVRFLLRVALSVLIATGFVLAVPSPPAVRAAPTLPEGFVLTNFDTGQGEFNLTDFTYLPDGSILTTGKNGAVTWLDPGSAAPRTIATLQVVTSGDSGLLGIAVPPDFATSRQVYTTRALPTGDGFVWRLSRWTATGEAIPSGLSAERTILEVPGNSFIHGMSGIEIGDDGTLWVSMGDSGSASYRDPRALRAQELDAPYGKLFHLMPSGAGVPTNPFYQPASPDSVRSKVFASGFRSPFRFSLDPASGTPILGDVGWYKHEEINIVRAGQNYKWPCWEGAEPTPEYRDLPACANTVNTPPLWTYPHPVGNSVTGGIVYQGNSYPEEYEGSYFFGDYVSQKIWTLRFDSSGNLTRAPQDPAFAGSIGAPVSFAAAPNGDIVYADIASGLLRRLSYAPGNNPPVAQANTSTDPATRTVTFDAGESFDFDGDPLTMRWQFGDGTTATGPRVSHTYPASPDEFTATLRVSDPFGANDTIEITVAPSNESPVVTISSPDADGEFAVGETISLTAAASDREDGALAITWTSTEIHCPSAEACHAHPGPAGSGNAFAIPFTEHPDTRIEITATATDSAGVSHRATYVAQPRQHLLTLESNIAASLRIGSDETAATLVTAGSQVTISAADTALDGVATFESWADGVSGRSRTLTMPDRALNLSVIYLTPIDRRFAADPGLGEIIGAPTGPEIAEGGIRYRDHEHGRLYWTAETGVHEMHGGILARYKSLGAHGRFGVPLTDETTTPDGIGRYNHLAYRPQTLGASIYWTPSTGAHAVWGAIRVRWAEMGWERGVLGYPTTSERATPDGVGRYNHFAGHNGNNGSIYWTPRTGAQAIYGAIWDRWAAMSWERGVLGYPTTGETSTPDGVGRYNHFAGHNGNNGSIYWTPRTGAHDVYGAIWDRWAALGWERSYLGYPTSGEYGVPGGRRSDFQHGYIRWAPYSGVTDRRY